MGASACFKERVPLKKLGHRKRSPEIMTVPLKCMAASAPLKYIAYMQFMAASALRKNTVSTEKQTATATFVK